MGAKILSWKIGANNFIRKMYGTIWSIGEKTLGRKMDVKNSSWKINRKHWSSRCSN